MPTFVLTALRRYRLREDPNKLESLDKLLARSEPETHAILEFLSKDSVAIDVGAHRGIYTRVLASQSKYVLAFEPYPPRANQLRGRKIENCEVIEAAASDEVGATTLRVPIYAENERSALATIAPTNSLQSGRSPDSIKELPVRTTSLDHEVSQRPIDSVSFIKIDVEGHEFAVLRGAVRTIEQHAPVVMVELEFRHGGDPQSVFDWMSERGYRALALQDGKTFKPIDAATLATLQSPADLLRKEKDLKYTGYVNNVVFVPSQAGGLESVFNKDSSAS